MGRRVTLWDLRDRAGIETQIPKDEWEELEWRVLGGLLEEIDETGVIEGASGVIEDLDPEGALYGPVIARACLSAVSEVYNIDDLEKLNKSSQQARRSNLLYSMVLEVWNEAIGVSAAPPASSRYYEEKKTKLLDGLAIILRPIIHRRHLHLPEPFMGDSGFVVMSYARTDLARLAPIIKRVVQWGYRVWYDRGIPGGSEWDHMIEHRIALSDGVLFFLSDAAASSKWVRREIRFADSIEKPIVVVALDPEARPEGLNLLLSQQQIIDGTKPTWQAALRLAMHFHRGEAEAGG